MIFQKKPTLILNEENNAIVYFNGGIHLALTDINQ